MAKRSSTLAKLTRPRLHGAAQRERLFARLDECRETKSAICVVGPPGAGKTTVVASWLDARKVPGLWYQVDPGDADAATFFFYLSEAAAPFADKSRHPLPLLTPEYQHDLIGFSRRFFRALFGLLPVGSIVVLDNYQEVESGQMFHQLVAESVVEVPSGSALVVVSRRDPPDVYARLVANESVGFIEWEDLRLSLQEVGAIIRARLPDLDGKEIQRLLDESGGWAAGLTLMIDSYRRREGADQGLPIERDRIFSYFATQIFERLPLSTREFLVATAILPQVPVSLARDLTGNSEVPEILEDLYRRHLFTHRRPGAEPTYWYHALFRAFLKGKADEVLSVEANREIGRKAARLLEARQDFDEAFQLFHDSADWPATRRLIERHARTLLAQGRGKTLREWVLSLPTGVLEDTPWLRYWLGTSLVPLDQGQARAHLERAFGQFAGCSDLVGQALSAAGVVDSHFFEWSDFRPLRRWVDILDSLVDRMQLAGDQEIEKNLHSSLLIGMLYAAPDHRRMLRIVERVTEMLDEDMDVNSKATTAMMLLSYSNLTCDMKRAHRAAVCIEAFIEHEDLTPLNRLWCNLRLGYYYPIIGNYGKGRETLDQATKVSEEFGLQGLRRISLLIGSYQVSLYGNLGDVRSMRKWQSRNAERADPSRPMDAWHVTQSRVHLDATAGHFGTALEWARRTIDSADMAGMTYIKVLGVEHAAGIAALIGDFAVMTDMLGLLRRLTAGTCFAFFECQARLYETYFELAHGDPDRGRRNLPDLMRQARSLDFLYVQMARYTLIAGTVLAESLRMDAETDYVKETIRRLGIRPPADAPASWPWPVKVLALGRFEIESDGEKLEFSGKAPRRVLSVLKAIVAGGGQPVPGARLVDSLWPDEEGDAGRKALDVCLVRLRKLLGHTDAVIVRDEQVSLNRELCWVDAWAFGDLVETIEREPEDSRARTRLGTHAMELYHGNFLPADDDDRSALVARLKYRDLYARLVAMLGQGMETARRWDEALAIYRRGIDADELAEEFYQGLMRCHAATGRSAEGVAVYRRLRQTLSVVLNIKPSERTEQLARLLREDDGGAKA